MTGRSLVPVTGKWTCILLLCYMGWTLEKVKIVDCTITNYEYEVHENLSSSYWNSEQMCTKNDSWNALQQNKNYIEEKGIGSNVHNHSYVPSVEPGRKNYLMELSEAQQISKDFASFPMMENLISQFHILSSAKIKNELCRNQSRILLEGIQEFDIWALKMLDSSAKLPPGILNGNINQYGDYDQCLNIEVDLESQFYSEKKNLQLKGKYCLAFLDIDLRNATRKSIRNLDDLIFSYRHFSGTVNDAGHRISRFTTVNWGFCIPSSCSAQDLTESLMDNLQIKLMDRGINFTAKVDPNMCYIKDSQPISIKTKLVLTFFMSLLGLVIIGTWIDNREKPIIKGKILSILKAFSLQRNLRTLLCKDESPNDITYIHGVRALNALALLIFHKSAALAFKPFINRTNMIEAHSMGWSVIGRTAIIYTDTFILISGLLTSYSLLRELDRKKKISIWRKYLFRYIRFTPNMLAIILFCTYIMIHLGSGPQWNLVVKHHSDVCQENMWKNFLYIHNYYGFQKMCLTHTHQLAIDMQLYIIAPIFIYLLWTNHQLGLVITTIVILLSTILRFAVTYTKNLSTVIFFGARVSQLFDTANLSYTLPTHRASVYLIGILLGYMLQQKKTSITLNKVQVLLGWTVAFFLGLVAMCGPYHMSFPDYKYSPLDAAVYNAFSPILWGTFISLGIFLGSNGYGGFIEDFLSWRGFKIFSQISYAVYLTQFPIFFYNVGKQRAPIYYSSGLLFEVGEVITIIIASVVLTLLIDLPFQELRKCFWNEGPQRLTTNNRQEQNDIILENEGLDMETRTRRRKCKSG